MYPFIIALFTGPVIVSGLLFILPKSISRILIITAAVVFSSISVYLITLTDQTLQIAVPAFMHQAVVIADLALLLFFGWIAYRRKSLLVAIMTSLQLAGTIWLMNQPAESAGFVFNIDKLCLFMFLLINVISGIIAVYSIRYMEEEPCSGFRKKYFMSVIFWFIAVMNLVVASDNLEFFFLFFELTTLASFLLIGFRRDEISVKNSLTALWMNQAGGIAILAAIIFLRYNNAGETSFTHLLQIAAQPGFMLPVALLSVAALVKGAQMPFSKWLLGAMVAPTPVSALLHSSTMVKIAPFVILRLSPALQGTAVSTVIIAFTGFVFAAAAFSALSQDVFKRILAYSTVALLALMIMMAAAGTPVTLAAALILMLFHGLSKCLLFLNAGIMEREFHLKQSTDMDRLAERGPVTSFIITFGFLSLLLPPFGAFIGKWFSIESMGVFAQTSKIAGALVIAAIALGGAMLSLLYFKVIGVLIARNGNDDRAKPEHSHPIYRFTSYLLVILIVAGMGGLSYLVTDFLAPVIAATLQQPVPAFTSHGSLHIGNMSMPLLPLAIAFFLLPAVLYAAMFIRFKKVDRVKEYMCGEKVNYSFSSYYFSVEKITPWFTVAGILFFITLLAVVIL